MKVLNKPIEFNGLLRKCNRYHNKINQPKAMCNMSILLSYSSKKLNAQFCPWRLEQWIWGYSKSKTICDCSYNMRLFFNTDILALLAIKKQCWLAVAETILKKHISFLDFSNRSTNLNHSHNLTSLSFSNRSFGWFATLLSLHMYLLWSCPQLTI